MVGHPAGMGTLLVDGGETLLPTHIGTGDQSSSAYTTEMGKCYKLGLFFFESQFASILLI